MRNPRVTVLNAAAAALVVLTGHIVSAQAPVPRVVGTETDLLKAPGGTQLLHLLKGTSLMAGPAKGAWLPATIDGWIIETALRDDKRDGFDVSVSLTAGTTLRARPAGAPLASARLGALFQRVETRGGWAHVRRTGWISAAAIAVASAPAAPPSGSVAAPPPAPAAPITTVAPGSGLFAELGGSVAATLEAPLRADVLEHRNGWSHVRIDAWVHDAAVGTAQTPGGITGADVRAAPDKYVGQTVEWNIEVLGIQKADELRPELPAGQPYLLARGPLPETGFLYIAITNEEADILHRLQPLAKIKIRATIRAGRSRFLPTPVLNFVRRLD
jgi:hypothetical protein